MGSRWWVCISGKGVEAQIICWIIDHMLLYATKCWQWTDNSYVFKAYKMIYESSLNEPVNFE
jgi:hypothetical protein